MGKHHVQKNKSPGSCYFFWTWASTFSSLDIRVPTWKMGEWDQKTLKEPALTAKAPRVWCLLTPLCLRQPGLVSLFHNLLAILGILVMLGSQGWSLLTLASRRLKLKSEMKMQTLRWRGSGLATFLLPRVGCNPAKAHGPGKPEKPAL